VEDEAAKARRDRIAGLQRRQVSEGSERLIAAGDAGRKNKAAGIG
jgi:hypothetical protein